MSFTPDTLLLAVIAVLKPSECSTPKPPSSTWPTKFRCLHRRLEAINVVQAPPVLLNAPAAANVPAPGNAGVAALAVPALVPAPLVAAQGGNDFPANSFTGNESGEVNI